MRKQASIIPTFVLALAVPLGAQPVITANGVVNATGYQTKLAPNAVFVIFGSGMGPATLAAASAPAYPTSLAGTSITFTPASGGAAIPAKMVYTVASQVAGLLPSSIAPGVYAVQVTYNNQASAAQNVTVVARSFGIATANSSGTGTAQATIGNVNSGVSLVRFTSGSVAFGGFDWTLSPAHPGDTLVLWGTGGGADPANDTGGSSGDQTAAGNFVVIVGGRRIVPVYAGSSSGYPGLWQVNFKLPDDIALSCFATLQVSAGGEPGNVASLPIAAAGRQSCSDPEIGPDVLAKLDAGREIVVVALAIARGRVTTSNATVEFGSGFIARYTPARFLLPISGPRFGNCVVYDRTVPANGLDPASPDAFLDAGPALPLSGPGLPQGAALARGVNPILGPTYAYTPAASFAAGRYTLAGPGGSRVGPFNVSVDFPATFTVTNWDAISAIDRSKPLTFNWTGTGFQTIQFVFASSARVGSNQRLSTLNCNGTPAGPGTYTIPAEALAYLLPGTATMSIQAVNNTPFTAPLVGGGQTDSASFVANLNQEKNVPVQ